MKVKSYGKSNPHVSNLSTAAQKWQTKNQQARGHSESITVLSKFWFYKNVKLPLWEKKT